jgi:hypothetical protein
MDRARSTEDYSKVHGRRLSVSLMLQPHAFRSLVGAGGGAARGLGLLARNLTAWPTSTMGTRLRDEDADDPEMPALERFLNRAGELYRLPLPAPFNEPPVTFRGMQLPSAPVADPLELTPAELPLGAEAMRLWVRYHNECEVELAPHGEFVDVRDVAAKSAENACRLAAIFHVFEHGPKGEIGAEDMERGVTLARWYLFEARRILGLGEETEVAEDAKLLADWIGRQGGATPARDVLHGGPYRFRDKKRRDAATALLIAKGWLRKEKRGKAIVLVLNPKLEWED